jgi:hypothetical protein
VHNPPNNPHLQRYPKSPTFTSPGENFFSPGEELLSRQRTVLFSTAFFFDGELFELSESYAGQLLANYSNYCCHGSIIGELLEFLLPQVRYGQRVL